MCQKLGLLEPTPLRQRSCLTLLKRLCTCYHSEFDRSRSNGKRVGKGHKIFQGRWGPTLGMGTWQTPQKYAPLHLSYVAICDCCMSNGTSVITEIRQKNTTSRQGHLRSLEPTRIDRSNFPLVILSNDGFIISCRFRDKRQFQSKVANFPHGRWGNFACI